jgi:hypothetical protein
MLQLTRGELKNLKTQRVPSSWGGIRRALPYAFTEQGVAMLSSVLKSRQAVLVNIAIMRAFVRLRQYLSTSKALAHKLEQLEQRIGNHDEEIRTIFSAIRHLMRPPIKPKKQFGFHP